MMVAPGMKNYDGEAVASLAGPLRWAVDVSMGASVHIEQGRRQDQCRVQRRWRQPSRGTKLTMTGYHDRI